MTRSVQAASNDVIEEWVRLTWEERRPITTERDILVRKAALAFRDLRDFDLSDRGTGVPVSNDAVERYGYDRALDDAREMAGT